MPVQLGTWKGPMGEQQLRKLASQLMILEGVMGNTHPQVPLLHGFSLSKPAPVTEGCTATVSIQLVPCRVSGGGRKRAHLPGLHGQSFCTAFADAHLPP